MPTEPNSLAATTNIPMEAPSNSSEHDLDFQEKILTLVSLFESCPAEESLMQQVKTFAQKELPDIPLTHAIALCYRIASVDLPRTSEFSLPSLKIEETVPLSVPVQIGEVIAEIKQYLCRFIVASQEVIAVLAYYAAMTWFCRSLQCVPFLYITSGAPGSGKSTIAQAVAHISYRSCMVSSASSTAALSRLCSQRPCTLLVDELDSATPAFLQEITATLNAGSSGDVVRLIVERSSLGRQQLAALRSFGPKILVGLNGPAGTRTLHPATLSRCISITSQSARGLIPEPLPHFRQDTHAADLRRKLASMADQHGKIFLQTIRELHALDTLPKRTQDNYRPLMALAVLADQDHYTSDRRDGELLWDFLRAATVPEAELGRFLLSACRDLLADVIAPALREGKTSHPVSSLHGMQLTPPEKLSPPCICTLTHEPVTVAGTSGKESIKLLRVLQCGNRKYIKSIELLAALLLDAASPLQTTSSGKPMSHAEFCQHLKAFGCGLTRIASERSLFAIQDLCSIFQLWLEYSPADDDLR